MNESRRRMLTEYLGECWHEITDKGPYQSTCSKCGMIFGAIHLSYWDPAGFNRTFDTAQDMVDLVKKMEVMAEYPRFERYAWLKWPGFKDYGYFFTWLITDPAPTCELIAEWMEDT